MTSPRRQRKSRLARPSRRLALAGLAALASLVAILPVARPVRGATTERIVTDPHTGLAIDGIDPVAYFTDGAPLPGRGDYEYRYAGVVWRFRNPGNRAAFIDNPAVYMPRYGGYDPVAIGRGITVPGNPLLWVIAGERLYLFFSDEARARFLADPHDAIAAADGKWPTLVSVLVP
jgi:YHS domain-containing protein